MKRALNIVQLFVGDPVNGMRQRECIAGVCLDEARAAFDEPGVTIVSLVWIGEQGERISGTVTRGPVTRVKPFYAGNHTRFGIRFDCPGCGENHIVKTMDDDDGGAWQFNDDYDYPTLSPDVKAYAPKDPKGPPELQALCHFVLAKGVITFLDDSDHELKGKSVELPEIAS